MRHYEQLGLVTARRRANGYRDHDERDLALVAEIRALVGLGLELELELTRPFVECLRAGNDTGGSCPDSIAVYRAKLAEVDARPARLQAVRVELESQLRAALLARVRTPLRPRRGALVIVTVTDDTVDELVFRSPCCWSSPPTGARPAA